MESMFNAAAEANNNIEDGEDGDGGTEENLHVCCIQLLLFYLLNQILVCSFKVRCSKFFNMQRIKNSLACVGHYRVIVL